VLLDQQEQLVLLAQQAVQVLQADLVELVLQVLLEISALLEHRVPLDKQDKQVTKEQRVLLASKVLLVLDLPALLVLDQQVLPANKVLLAQLAHRDIKVLLG
jgi:hypothetical protein